MMSFPYSILFDKILKKKKIWGEIAGIFFLLLFLASQILLVFLLDISIIFALIYFA
jgi:hypothetical protein